MKFAVLPFALLAFVGGAFANDELDELESILKELRQRAVETGDTSSLADFALGDFAKAAGYVDGCRYGDRQSDIRDMADKYGAWSKPGFFSSINGAQTEAADRAFASANLKYSVAKVSALSEGCDRMMITVQEMGVRTHAQIFDQLLSGEPTE